METSPPEPSLFDRDTKLLPVAGGVLEGSISERWDARGGPHGGYLAALILSGMTIAIGDASRAPLTLTVQFVSQPAFGPVTLDATVERTGRSLTTITARLVQAGAPVALAMGAFGTAMFGLEFDELPMPEVEAPWADRRSMTSGQAPPFVRHFVLQPRFELPFQGEEVPMVAGGWTGRRFESGLPDYESPGNRLVSSRVGSIREILLGSNFTAEAVSKARRAARFRVTSRTTGPSAK
jgi:hypothetical protein